MMINYSIPYLLLLFDIFICFGNSKNKYYDRIKTNITIAISVILNI
jgi:hypothetical protein